jgi:hypothetical protein
VIDDAEPGDAAGGQELQRRAAEAPGSDDQHPARSFADPDLAVDAEPGDKQVSGEALDLLQRQSAVGHDVGVLLPA